mmetsp:Transcript_34612/g.79185  ORF Transcript_34612/g.79185 Transcript_34612/m.79185 type:complete len:565 (-) Transcript_34612:60-1754(-)
MVVKPEVLKQFPPELTFWRWHNCPHDKQALLESPSPWNPTFTLAEASMTQLDTAVEDLAGAGEKGDKACPSSPSSMGSFAQLSRLTMTRMTKAPEHEFCFEPGPLGLSLQWPEAIVVDLHDGPAKQAGVKVGWQLCRLANDDKAVSPAALERCWRSQTSYRAVFRVQPPPPPADSPVGSPKATLRPGAPSADVLNEQDAFTVEAAPQQPVEQYEASSSPDRQRQHAVQRRSYGGTLTGMKFLRTKARTIEELSEEEKRQVLLDLQHEDEIRLQEYQERRARLDNVRRKQKAMELQRHQHLQEQHEKAAAAKEEKDKLRAQHMRVWLEKKDREAAEKRAMEEEVHQAHLIKLQLERDRKEDAERQRRQDIERMIRIHERRREHERQELSAQAAELEEQAHLISVEYPAAGMAARKADDQHRYMAGRKATLRPQSAPALRPPRVASAGCTPCFHEAPKRLSVAAGPSRPGQRQRPSTAGARSSQSQTRNPSVAARSLQKAYGTYSERPKPPFRPSSATPAETFPLASSALEEKQRLLEERFAVVSAMRRSLRSELQAALASAVAAA